jgi:hypothetical protein
MEFLNVALEDMRSVTIAAVVMMQHCSAEESPAPY